MDVSLTVPTMLAVDRAGLRSWCRAIDAGPFASLAVPERTAWTTTACFPTLAACAAWTERVRLAATIVVLPSHDPVRAAKELATVDVLASGRLTVGVGVGGREQDYRAVGAPFDHRWQRLDDAVATLRAVWSGSVEVDGMVVGPRPVQDHVPVLAGALGPKATARAARWADGVTGAWGLDGDMATLPAALDAVRAAWRAAGRTEDPHLSTSLWFALGPDAERTVREYARRYMTVFGERVAEATAAAQRGFDPGALREAVAAAEAAGCHELFLVPTTTDVAEVDRVVTALHL